MKDFNYVQFLIGLAAMFISVGIAFGIVQSKVSSLENTVSSFKTDHDLLIRICANVEIMQYDIKEMKKDLKMHLNEHSK